MRRDLTAAVAVDADVAGQTGLAPGCGCGVARGGPGGSDSHLSPRRPRAEAPCAARGPVRPRRPDQAIPRCGRLQFSVELAD